MSGGDAADGINGLRVGTVRALVGSVITERVADEDALHHARWFGSSDGRAGAALKALDARKVVGSNPTHSTVLLGHLIHYGRRSM